MSTPKISHFLTKSPTMSVIMKGLTLQKKVNLLLKDHDLNLFSSLILMSIFFEESKTIRVGQLYEILPISKGNISHMTCRLESKRIIERFLVDEDLRGFKFKLTGKGSKICVSLIKIFNQIEDQTDRSFTKEEFNKFYKMLEEIK